MRNAIQLDDGVTFATTTDYEGLGLDAAIEIGVLTDDGEDLQVRVIGVSTQTIDQMIAALSELREYSSDDSEEA